jgi:hypothetical protein
MAAQLFLVADVVDADFGARIVFDRNANFQEAVSTGRRNTLS